MRPKTRKVRRLRQLRRDAEMSQRSLAKQVGLQASAICLIENGEQMPSLSQAEKLAEFFGLPIEEVFALVEVPKHV